MKGSAGSCTLKIMPHMMWAVPSLRRNHSQAKCRTGENKKLRSRNSHRNRSLKRCFRAVWFSRSGFVDQQHQCYLGKLFRNANYQALGLPNQKLWGGAQEYVFFTRPLGNSDSSPSEEYGSLVTHITCLLAVLSVKEYDL